MPYDARRAAFESLAHQVYEPLQRYLRRRCPAADVDDVFNETLITLWRRLDDVPAGAELPWCYGVARRTLANHRRADDRRRRLRDRLMATSSVPGPGWANDTDGPLHAALARLPEPDGEMVRLWAWEHLEPREIAVALDTTPNAVSLRLARIRRRLEVEIGRQDPAPAGHEHHDGHRERQR